MYQFLIFLCGDDVVFTDDRTVSTKGLVLVFVKGKGKLREEV